MDDKQLRNIAQILVDNVIEKAVDKIKAESREIDERLDQGVEGFVELTNGRSINAIREGQTSPSDNKMEGLAGHFDNEVDDIVELTIGRSIDAIRKGQTSPTVNKMEGLAGPNNTLVTPATPDVVTGTTGNDKPTGLKKGRITTAHAQMSKASHKKNILTRLVDRVLKRGKKEAKAINVAKTGGSTNTSVDDKKKSASKAHNKKDWIRRNLLCCFVRQTATVEPLFE